MNNPDPQFADAESASCPTLERLAAQDDLCPLHAEIGPRTGDHPLAKSPTNEHLTTVDLAGATLPALVRYTLDPIDGYPAIESVEVVSIVHRRFHRPYVQRTVLDIFPLMNAAALRRYEQEISGARLLWRNGRA